MMLRPAPIAILSWRWSGVIGFSILTLLPLCCLLIGGLLILSFLTLKADDQELSAVYAYITELDLNLMQTLRSLPAEPSYSGIETWTFVVNGVEMPMTDIVVATDADYLLLYLDQVYGDYQLAAVKADIDHWHAALNQYRVDVDPEPDTHRAWVQITLSPAETYFSAHPSEFDQDAVAGVKTLLAVGPYLTRQFLASPFAALGTVGVVTSRFGYRLHPVTGEPDFHLGLDLAQPEGTIVQAVWNGVVEVPPYDTDGYGHWLRITAGEHRVIYAHLSAISVNEGQLVARGDPIGAVGHTGSATGDHLHLEYHYRGQVLNPAFYLSGLPTTF
jgi:murein DD-endopeptidase MepM/ murein hydrolase activator NlpD